IIVIILFQSSNAQWTSLSVAGGDRGPLCVQGNTLFMGSTIGRLWRSTDQGNAWLTTPGYLSSGTYALASDGTTMYASRVTEKITKSTDNGVTWNLANTGLPTGYNPALLTTGGRVFAGNYSFGVYVSTDEGASWASANNGITETNIYALGGRGDTVFAGTYSGKLFRSTNGGQLWTNVTPSFSSPNSHIYFISVIDSSVFIGAIAFTSMGLARSDDWGLTWNQDNLGIATNYLDAGGIVKVDTFLFVGMYSGGIYRRSENVQTWSLVSTPQMIIQAPPVYPSTYYLSVVGIVTQGTTLFVQTSPAGLFRSTDLGVNWQQITNDAGGGHVSNSLRIGFARNGETMYIGGASGVFISTDNGGFWNTYYGNVIAPAYISSYAFVDTLVFAGQMALSGYGVLRSTDGGHFWIRVNTGLSTSVSRRINKVITIGSRLFAATQGGIYESSNLGDSWSATAYGNLNVLDIFANGNTLLAFRQGVLSRSTDFGQSWTDITNGISPWDFMAFATSGSRWFLGAGGVRMSTDDGVSWTDIFPSISNLQVYALATAGDTLYAATDAICYYTTNLGQSWTALPNSGLTGVPNFRALMVHGGYIYAGGQGIYGSGAWRQPIPGTTPVEQIDANVPDEFELMQNYPNPFNPTTTIRFGLHSASYVTLKIFNIFGQEVATLINEKRDAGQHSVQWNASGIASGVYFYRMTAGKFTEMKKMILLR
ncbi:MAG: T9SS type A sorting domain-containing protein, partial [Bacteroidota bacterium]|nr:T9SS type A sorting domain-containing protein [Bacteroidota bacterium]